MLAAAVAADPDAVAIIDGARTVSYRELDEWSTRLARVLIEAGVGPERAVGVAMDRCVELVVAWWAVVKAGGVYVPVDRAHPVERITMMLDAVDAVCVVTCGADTVAGAGARPVVRIDGLDVSGRCAEAITDADILIVDEALAVGDAGFRQKGLAFLEAFRRRGTLVLVSHDMEQIRALCDRVVWVDDGGVRASGEAAKVLRLYDDATEYEEDDGVRFRLDAEACVALSPAATNRLHKKWWIR